MLKRNKVLIAFLVVAVLIASVGFAAVADDLILKGNITLNLSDGESEGETKSPLDEEFEANVYWAEYKGATPAPTGVTGTIDSTDTDTLTISLDATALTKIGQSVTVNATIGNKNMQKVKVDATAKATGDITKYVEVKVEPVTGTDIIVDASTDGTTAQTVEVKITYKLIAVPADNNSTKTGEYSLTLTATPVDPT